MYESERGHDSCVSFSTPGDVHKVILANISIVGIIIIS